MDVDTIDLGTDFVVKIEQAIGQCDVVLALIGDDWLTVKDRAGRRRIDRPDDFVRLEIAHALARDKVVEAKDPASEPERGRHPAPRAPQSTRGWKVAALCGYAFVWFLVVGLRLQERRLSRIGLVYAAIALAVFVLIGWADPYNWEVLGCAILWLFCGAPSAIHYFAIRPRYT